VAYPSDSYTKAHNSDAGGANFYGQVFRERLDGAERGANGCRAFYMTARRAACQENDRA